ncbi:MAG: ABC transporter ATP-binding protein [Chloroflexi bacterium]|nr:ABC transporter ATP-binding protein [Chloroflexota bacterium]
MHPVQSRLYLIAKITTGFAVPKPIVQLVSLSKSYTETDNKRVILDEVTIQFYEGEFAVLLGPSGSGKSTMLNLMSGIDAPDDGGVIVNGTDITTLSEHTRTIFRRNHIGIIFQSFNLIPTLTVMENVTLPYELQGNSRKQAEIKATDVLAKVGLAGREKSYPDRLSGGQQQRVAIARAIVHQPDLIVADEPTGNLDHHTGETILKLLLNMTRDAGKTLIMATHSMDIIPYADRVFRIEDGKLIEDTERLRIGAEIKAELEAKMHAELAHSMAQLEAVRGGL